MVCFQVKTLQQQQESGCDLDKKFMIGFLLKSTISKIKNIEYILIVILIQSQSLFICFSYFWGRLSWSYFSGLNRSGLFSGLVNSK